MRGDEELDLNGNSPSTKPAGGGGCNNTVDAKRDVVQARSWLGTPSTLEDAVCLARRQAMEAASMAASGSSSSSSSVLGPRASCYSNSNSSARTVAGSIPFSQLTHTGRDTTNNALLAGLTIATSRSVESIRPLRRPDASSDVGSAISSQRRTSRATKRAFAGAAPSTRELKRYHATDVNGETAHSPAASPHSVEESNLEAEMATPRPYNESEKVERSFNCGTGKDPNFAVLGFSPAESVARTARLEGEVVRCAEDISLLRQEVRVLQSDNAVLLRQLEDLIVTSAALTFDSERYKAKLEETGIQIPPSLYNEVCAQNQIPQLSALQAELPPYLLDACVLDRESKRLVNFSSVAALAQSVTDLQIRLRERNVHRLRLQDERVEELERSLETAEQDLKAAVATRQALTDEHEARIQGLSSKHELAISQIASLEEELVDLKVELEAAKSLQDAKLEELKNEELEQKVRALREIADSTTDELAKLRIENTSLASQLTVARSEAEYFTSTLQQERASSATLRQDRESLTLDLNETRSNLSQSSAEIAILNSKLDLSERMLRSVEAARDDWMKKVTALQSSLTEYQAVWEQSLQESIMKRSQAEAKAAALEATTQQLQSDLEARKLEVEAAREAAATEAAKCTVQIAELTRAKDLESTSKRKAQECISQLEAQNREIMEQNQLLVDKVEMVEAQAEVLKSKHPAINFGVLEEVLREKEATQLATAAELTQLRLQIEAAGRNRVNLQELCAQLQSLSAAQRLSIRDLEEAAAGLRKKVQVTTDLLTTAQAANNELQQQIRCSSGQILQQNQKLAERDSMLEAMRLEHVEATEKLQQEAAVLKRQCENCERRIENLQGELEIAAQAHRLEVRAHSSDLLRLEKLQDEMDVLRCSNEDELKKQRASVAALESQIGDFRCQIQTEQRSTQKLEQQRALLEAENASLRELVNSKLDDMELSDNELKRQLAERFSCQGKLKSELDAARLEFERQTIELKSSRAMVSDLQNQLHDSNSAVKQLRTDLERVAKSDGLDDNSISLRGEQRLQIASLEQKVERLQQDVQHETKLRMEAEKALQNVLIEVSPIRQREAALRGKVVSLENALSFAEKDAKTYRTKFLDLTRGRVQELEASKNELLRQFEELKESTAQQVVSIRTVTSERDNLKSEVERCKREQAQAETNLTAATGQVHSLQSQLQSLQTQVQNLQQQKQQAPDNTEIQKRYQMQITNFQRLLQQVNAERDRFKSDLDSSTHALSQKKIEVEQLESKLSVATAKLQSNSKLQTKSQPSPVPSSITSQPRQEPQSFQFDTAQSGYHLVSESLKLALLSELLVAHPSTNT